MSRRLRIQALSYAYPPLAFPRAVQVARLLAALNADTVLYWCGHAEARKDETMAVAGGPGRVRVRKVAYSPGIVHRLLERIYFSRFDFRLPLQMPDPMVFWQPAVRRRMAADLKSGECDPDILVTFGMPMSDHLTGLHLKKAYGLPWVVHMSDPWVDNPYIRYSRASKALNTWQERRVFKAADRIVFTSPDALELVMGRYPGEMREKAVYLPHCFDPDGYGEVVRANPKETVIRHLGQFYGPRTPIPLINAFERVYADSPELLRGVRVEFIGEIPEREKQNCLAVELPDGLVVFLPSVPYEESLRLMRSADGLVVIDAVGQRGIFFPSKLVDYIGAGRPVLGAVDPEGTSAGIVGDFGVVADGADPAALAKGVSDFLELCSRKKENETGRTDAALEYSAAKVAERFEGELRSLVKES